ncbi:MAG: VWA domain-containing protein [Anaerolineae bacterium]
MQLLWPWFIFLLLVIPLLIGGYILLQRRRRRYVIHFSSLTLIRPARPQSNLRRHLPPALLLAALAVMIVALSRPVSVVSVPTVQTTILLAIDVSGSMRSTDVQPSRIEAAENAALNFINHQKFTTQIGIVAFSGNAELVQAPTTDRDKLTAAIRRLTLGRFTAIGSGILRSIDAIAEIDPTVAPSINSDAPPAVTPTPVVPGAYAPDIIVLLTDGVSNAGPLPVDAAQQAADRGVRVYTIAFGTENGQFVDPQQGPGQFGGGGGRQFGGGRQQGGNGGGGFGRFRAGIDVATLQKVSDMTGGSFYTAESADQLEKVFSSLPLYLVTKHEVMELTVGFTAAGVVLAVAALVLSMLWNPMG